MSELNYPIQLIKLEENLSLYIPDPQLVKHTYEKLLAINKTSPFPFWAKIWASSKALTSFLLAHPEIVNNKHVLEIGAGIGQPSFTIATKCKEIIISDHNKDAVELLKYNIQNVELSNATAMHIDWNAFPVGIETDVILLSDINYAPDQFEPLLNLIKKYLNLGTSIVIATPQRIMAAAFIEKLQDYVQQQHTTHIPEENGITAISIYLLGK